MVVMKTSTMKAQTRLDLKTSSLICEYCTMKEEEDKEKKNGGKEVRGRWRNKFSDEQKRLNESKCTKQTDALPQMQHATVQPQALERDRSWWVSCGVLGKVRS